MPLTTLGQLISEIGEYDEYRPIYIQKDLPLSNATPCYIVFGDASGESKREEIRTSATDRGMVPFLSSGQMMDAEGALQYAKEDYTEAELFQVLEKLFKSL